MERLTYWNKETECWSYHGPGGEAAKRLAAYEDTGLEPEEINRVLNAYGRGMTLRTNAGERLEIIKDLQTERLKELAQAEKDGGLVVLPCKWGDEVWVILEDKKPQFARVHSISISPSCDDTLLRFGGYPPGSVWGGGLGKTWFLTREEAEAALKKREEEDNEAD